MLVKLFYVMLAIYAVRRLIWFNNAAGNPAVSHEKNKGKKKLVNTFVVCGCVLAVCSILLRIWEIRLYGSTVGWRDVGHADIAKAGYVATWAGLWCFSISAFIADTVRVSMEQARAKRIEDYFVKTYGFPPANETDRRK